MPMLITFRIRLPVWPSHVPPRTRLEKSAIRSSTAWYHIFAVDQDRLSFRHPQGDVQNGAFFGRVDLLAAKHRIGPRPQSRFFGELQQQLQRFIGDAAFRVIQVDPRRLGSQTFTSLGVFREQLAHMQPLDFPVVRVEGIPGWSLGQWRGRCHHVCTLSKV